MRSASHVRASLVLAAACLLLGVTAPGAAGQAGEARHSLREALTDQNFYFVMADRFENGTPANDLGGLPADRLISGYDPTARGFYHGGDLRGIIRRLNYIQSLGTTAIWLTPSFKNRAVQLEDGPSAGYHGYWITDFTQIDPHLGTNEDLRRLVDQAHRRGMKVFFDIITNHTADVIQYREGARTAYVSKDEQPFRDATGTPFDDRDHAGSDTFPELNPDVSFPYHPFVPEEAPRKTPDWLNDVTNYHNRGNTTFTGEDSQYGDFFGLDDLFTEKPEVVQGMIDIYETWVREYKIDGFRIDTMKHVDDRFWQIFGPEVLRHARQNGVPDFFMFGEVADDTLNTPLLSAYTTRNEMQSVLDFGFQTAAVNYIARNGSPRAMADLILTDDWYTDQDSNVYQLPTFLGNHDRGRFGFFLRGYNPDASDRELLMRSKLGHALMYFSRGMPVVYYGDEQGFTGDGGDQLARQDMFPSRVPEYNDDDLIGTRTTTAQSNFDRGHPLYTTIARLARLTERHRALRDGAHQNRYADEDQGIYAFSRIGRQQQREYVVAVNNAEEARTAVIPTYSARRGADKVYGPGPGSLRTNASGGLRVTVPALSAVVYRIEGRIPASPAAPAISIASAQPSEQTASRLEVRAEVEGDSFYEVTFEARIGDGGWQAIGTDDTAPHRVFHDVSRVATGTAVSYRAIVLDNAGHTRTSQALEIASPAPGVRIESPPEGSGARDRVRLLATTDPDRADQSVRFERRLPGGDWVAIGTDTSSPAYVTVDDISGLGLADGDRIEYRAVLIEGGGNQVVSATRTVEVRLTPVRTAVIHYLRANGDYDDWGLHLFGGAIDFNVDWNAPFAFAGVDADGARFEVPIADSSQRLCFIVHLPGRGDEPFGREPGGDRCFVPVETPEIWLVQGDARVYYADPTP